MINLVNLCIKIMPYFIDPMVEPHLHLTQINTLRIILATKNTLLIIHHNLKKVIFKIIKMNLKERVMKEIIKNLKPNFSTPQITL